MGIWKSRYWHHGISIGIDVGIGIGIVNFFLLFEALIFALRSLLLNKKSMLECFSNTLQSFPESVCCCLEQSFCREVVSACFRRKELRHGRYLRSFKHTQGWKLQLVCLCISGNSTSWKFSVSFKIPFRNLVSSSVAKYVLYACKYH